MDKVIKARIRYWQRQVKHWQYRNPAVAKAANEKVEQLKQKLEEYNG